jgi:Flp pilus assembly protein TadG
MNFRNDDEGQILVVTALTMIILLAFLGFAIDVGYLFWVKRNAQTAADAAAIAGALDYQYNTSIASAQTAGQSAASANGFTNGSNGVTVTVNAPPKNGPDQKTGYVEAIVQQSTPTFFMAMLGPSDVTVAARAVAGTSGPGYGCVYVLGGSGITESGNNDSISSPNCPLYDAGGITLSGTNNNITASQINMEGSLTQSGTGSVSPSPTHVGSVANPLTSLNSQQPSYSGCTTLTGPFTGIQAGKCYNIVSSGTNTINLASSTTPYVFTGITAAGSLTITGTGVTIYMPTGGITGSGNIGLDITAPTSGSFDGIALWLASNNSSGITLSGSTTTGFQGIIYAPDSSLTVSGTTTLNLTADIVVSSITGSGSTNITDYRTVNSGTALGSGSGSASFGLVE